MLRLPLLAAFSLLSLASPGLRAAEPVPEDVRAKAIREWRAAYDRKVERLAKDIAAAREDAKHSATAAVGRRNLARLLAEEKQLHREPFNFREYAIVISDSSRIGKYGHLQNPVSRVIVGKRAEGMVIETSYTTYQFQAGFGAGSQSSSRRIRFILADPQPKAMRAGVSVRLAGLYYVTGTAKIAGQQTPVLLRILPLPSEVPAGLKTKTLTR